MEKAVDFTDKLKCDHEPDPATIEYDGKHGRRGVCMKCGAKLIMSRYFIKAGEPHVKRKKMTSSEKRRAKRERLNQETT